MREDAMQHSQGGEHSVHASINPSIHIDSRFEVAEEVLTPLQSSDLPIWRTVRPGWGTLGSLTAVRTNLFALELTRDTLYEYGVTISPHPRSSKAHVKRRVLALFEQSPTIQPYINQIAHDGAHRLISTQRLPQPLRGNVDYFEDYDEPHTNPDTYSVEVTFSKELHTALLKRCVLYSVLASHSADCGSYL